MSSSSCSKEASACAPHVIRGPSGGRGASPLPRGWSRLLEILTSCSCGGPSPILIQVRSASRSGVEVTVSWGHLSTMSGAVGLRKVEIDCPATSQGPIWVTLVCEMHTVLLQNLSELRVVMCTGTRKWPGARSAPTSLILEPLFR